MSRDQYAALVGEHGDARISTSMELKDSDFGTGFGCHVTVSLTCEQETDKIEEAGDLSARLAAEYVAAGFQLALDVFKQRPKVAKSKRR